MFFLLGLIVLTTTVFFLRNRQAIFDGNMIKNADAYILEFTKMNQEDSHTLTLDKGDILSVDFAVGSGRVDLSIGMDEEEAIYRANEMDTGVFELTVPKKGDYQITVRARHASGYIKITLHGQDK